ncbi:flavin reductase family protein [Roseobacter ponti]|uniref:Flavin reductase family protein n=1 Tax=Roseobacter ponti TaxID=1891787 RepID=A0A858SR78_9RHOB|nr:flavin reductase family protein [Roseobacter ponti]QJF50183.1 flavin reductase family protein [Roseobacter ponti]
MTGPDKRALRNAFGSYMTGVTVVTTRTTDGTPVGFTANSFTSVSLDPPLLLVCPGRFLSSFDSFSTCSHFAVNILSEGQEEVANTFAGYKGDRFARVQCVPDEMGSPLIHGALAQFSCSTHQSLDAGDHQILIGRIRSFEHFEGRGLGYAGGRFFSLGLERSALGHAGSTTVSGAIVTCGDGVLLEKTDAGYRPPQIPVPDSSRLRRDLVDSLSERGLHIDLGPAYSVFDDGKTWSSYFIASASKPYTGSLEVHPVPDIPNLPFASKPVHDMMNRFAVESQTRSFGFYLGGADRGDIHHLPERT